MAHLSWQPLLMVPLQAFIPVPGDQAPVQGLARAIQLSVAPVFLLTGVSALIGVLTHRLSRVMDRADQLVARLNATTLPEERSPIAVESFDFLRRRSRLLMRAIQSATLTGVLVAAVVAVMFVSAVAAIDLAAIVVPLFVVAMLALMVALLLLLRETQIATAQLSRRF
ncbi:DUF2721 domain-containing protein [Cyanobium sp. FGCU-6]|jgi:hypothetical protein|nr:DUF2721 domain-containing protein [Cyanobium sp. FGCU6]